MEKGSLKRFYIITSPRTASNLLHRILNLDEQSSVASSDQRDYLFIGTQKWQVDDELCCKPLQQWSREERDGIFAVYQSGLRSLQAVIQQGEAEKKNIFAKEHLCFMIDPVAESKLLHGIDDSNEMPWTVAVDGVSSTHTALNPTILPDEFFKTWLPTLLIRHPAIAFPSFLRVATKVYGEAKANTEEIFTFGTTLRWSKMIYEYFAEIYGESKDSPWPIVLDADDFITDPELLRDYAKVVGLDPQKLKFDWEAVNDEARNMIPQAVQTMGASLFASSGILQTKSPKDMNIEEEAKKWEEEFGKSVARSLERRVRDAMPDYEYLRSKKFPREHTTS